MFQSRRHALTADFLEFLHSSWVGSYVDDFKIDFLLFEIGQSVYAPRAALFYVKYGIVHSILHTPEWNE